MGFGTDMNGAAQGAGMGSMFGGPVGAGIGAVAGLGAGLLGSAAEHKKQQAEAQIRAAEIQASPWTHMAPQQQITFAAPTAGNAIAGAGAGLGLAQNLAKASQPSPWANMNAQPNAQTQAMSGMQPVGGIAQNGTNAMMLDNQKMPNLYGA